MKKRNLISTILLISVIVCGCGNTTLEGQDAQEQSEDLIGVEIESLDELKDDKTLSAVEGEYDDDSVIKVAVTGEPAIGMLEKASDEARKLGYKIEVVPCEDYNTPNEMLLNGEVTANFCEHEGFVTSYNKIHSTELTIAEKMYFLPMGIYKGTVTDMNHVPSGAKVAVPQGEVNVARALYLLQQKGLLSIEEGHSFQVTCEDIIDNPYNIVIEEVDIADVNSLKSNYGLYMMDANKAMSLGIENKERIATENRNSEMAQYFSICIVTNMGMVNDPRIVALCDALNSSVVEKYIENEYEGTVIDYR